MTVSIGPLTTGNVNAADRVFRLAFGTQFGMADPLTFRGDAEALQPRLWSYPDGGFVAEDDGKIIGVAMANNWGSLGLFGPIAVDPARWHGGVARMLLDATMPVFDRWSSRVVGLFTFPESTRHVRLYQGFGFWPRGLTAIIARAVTGASAVQQALSLAAHSSESAALLRQCTELTGSIFEGLDLTREIEAVLAHSLGDTILLSEGSRMTGLAICHAGKGSEAGSGTAYVKFAAVRPGAQSPRHFAQLLAACCDFAYRRGATQLSAGVNLGRMSAYRLMIEHGFRATMQGVAMHRPWVEAYDRSDIFALDDWR